MLTTESPEPSLFDRLGDLAGRATNLPPDASAQHDHYLYERTQIAMTPVFADAVYFLALWGPASMPGQPVSPSSFHPFRCLPALPALGYSQPPGLPAAACEVRPQWCDPPS